MCSVYSAVSGDTLAVVNDYQGKTGTQMKHSLAAQLGVTRFRQRLYSADGEVQDDEVIASAAELRLVVLEFLPEDFEEDERMISAAKSNDVRTLQNLLNCPRSPNVRHECGAPLLHAAAKGYMEPLQLLIEAAADLNARNTDPQGWTALLLAAQFGHVDSVHSLIEAGADTDLATLDLDGTALHVASERGHAEVVQVLLEAGMDHSKARSSDGSTPLYIAAQTGYANIVGLLIMAGVDLDRRNGDSGGTAMYAAASFGHIQVVRALVEARANMEKALPNSGATPLYVAARQGLVQVVHGVVD